MSSQNDMKVNDYVDLIRDNNIDTKDGHNKLKRAIKDLDRLALEALTTSLIYSVDALTHNNTDEMKEEKIK